MVRERLAGPGLVVLASLLFAGSFPNPLFPYGFPALAWVAYVPVFLLVRRSGLAESALWGALYGYLSFLLFNYWLINFSPLAGVIVPGAYALFFAALFPMLRLAVAAFPRRAYLAHWVIWLGFEYVRTLGFLGYPYGIAGYSQWRALPLIQIADVFGVWGVSALVVFPSAWIAAALADGSKGKPLPREAVRTLAAFFRKEGASAVVWLAALTATLIYGIAVPRDFSREDHANIALVQQNTDPWRGGALAARVNLGILTRLSDEALAAEPRPDMVVWSETAFVPRIHWHRTYRDPGYAATWQVVRELLDFLAARDAPFVIGTHHGERNAEGGRVGMNAALLMRGEEIAGVYGKTRLVPFTEHFPFEGVFPRIHRALLGRADTSFWDPGTEFAVFEGPGFRFATPICFEDSFGSIPRTFVREGAEVLVNLSNKAWARSLSAQNQQLGMAVFRAVENRRSVVRSTSSGQTAAIDPAGRIVALAPPFEEAWVTASVPIVRDRATVYTRLGDLPGIAFAVAAALLVAAGGAARVFRRRVPRLPDPR